jgi:signal transduction histidine kinase
VILRAAIELAVAVLAVFAAIVTVRVSRAPGWRDQRWFTAIALATAVFATAGIPARLVVGDALLATCVRIRVAAALGIVIAWCLHSEALLGRRAHPLLRRARWALAAAALAVLVPGLALRDELLPGRFEARPVSTPFAWVVYAVGLAGAAVVVVRFAAAWRRGSPLAALHAGALALVLCAGVNDVLVTAGAYDAPFLLDLALAVPLAVVTWGLADRIAADASTLHELRDRLEQLVDVRTRDLARTQEALQLSGRLASLGHFAAGVAHEVNNPAAVVSANLRYLAEHLEREGTPPDAVDSVRDALASMTRINELVRRLVDAGRLAGSPNRGASSSVAQAVRQALADARARAGERVRFEEAVPGDLHVHAKPELLQQVLGHLLANAAEAVPDGRPGRVDVRAERTLGRVRIVVQDDGAGMADGVLRRAFEPFFSTKPAGGGSGLGLPVSRGIAESHGGDLWLESAVGAGTRAVLELPEAAPQV